MANPIIRLKKSGEKDKAPDSLAQGELAVNYNVDSPALYIEDSAGNVIKLADAGAVANGKVASVSGEAPIIVDGSDPLNPVVKFDDAPDGGVDGTTQYARQVVTSDSGVTQTKTWAPVDIPPGTHTGETPPLDPIDGQTWWNSSDDSGRLYVYYDDGDSQQWVEASPQGDTLTESDADTLYLSKLNNDTAEGAITFEKLTTHKAGVDVVNAVINIDGSATFAGGNIQMLPTGYLSSARDRSGTDSTLEINPEAGPRCSGWWRSSRWSQCRL